MNSTERSFWEEEERMQSKRIKVSSKRQITIPQTFYDSLDIGDEVECFLKDGELIIRPVKEGGNEFADLILEDLIKQGVSKENLVDEFRKAQQKVKPAVQRMISDAKKLAKENRTEKMDETQELFGDL